MKFIKTLPAQPKLHELLEYRNGELYWKTASKGHKIGTRAGCINYTSGYRMISIDSVRYAEHRIIWAMFNGDPLTLLVDHKDRNPLNNRIENLRDATESENQCNRRGSNNRLGEKNIYKYRTGYIVKIQKNKEKCSKYFKDLHQAIAWRDTNLVEIHGDFAYNLN